MWNKLRHTKRCVVLAQGFYEWQHVNGKQAFYMTPKMKTVAAEEKLEEGLLYMAGLYDSVDDVGNVLSFI